MSRLARPCRIALVVLLLALTIRVAASAPQIIPTSSAPEGPRTAMIVGQVVDATGTPVPEAIVRLTMPRFREDLPTTPNGRVMADSDGRYFFADLPAGEYYLQASKDGFAGGIHGQRRASGESQLLTLAVGERRTDLNLTLWKYAVIAGTVVDELGEPVVGVGVRALTRHIRGGRERFGDWSFLVPTAVTDDRGMFRLSEVLPGTYVIAVPSTQTTLPVALLDASAQDASLRSDLFFGGIMEVAPLGKPGIQQMGDFALLTLTRVLIPPPLSPDGRMQVYRTTYFPAAGTAAAATRVRVASGEERAGLAVTLRPLPAVRISGRLVTPDGSAPPQMALRLVGEGAAGVMDDGLVSGSGPMVAGFDTVNTMSDASGRFMLLGVPPGEYVLQQANRFLSREVQQGRPAYWISQRISVGTSDLLDVAVTLRPAIRVEGRFEYQGANGAQPAPADMVSAITFETPYGEPGRVAAEVRRDGTQSFATVAAAGRFIVNAYRRSGWFVKSVTLDGKDVTDRVIDLQSDATTFVVTYTDRPSKVSGTVKDDRGAANPNAIVLAFPVDPARWTGYGSEPRTLTSTLTTRTGVYTFDHLPAGEYYVIAIDDAQSDDWRDPKLLEALAGQATKLTVGAGDAPKTLDLTLRTIR